jgi:purine nucleosidase
MNLPRRKILIDTDTASDDAVALIMALRSEEVDVEAITVVAGNVPVEQATRNALFTAELCESDVPVFRGAEKPLIRELQIADWFHGRDGLGDHGYAPSRRRAERGDSIGAICSAVAANPGIEIITLGPLTNVALAVQREPALVENVSLCVVMGGAPCCEGNVTPAAEFNIWVDPEAARIVFQSGLSINLIGWQLSRGDAVLNERDIADIEQIGTPSAEFAIRCNSVAAQAFEKQTGEAGIVLPDPVAMGILLDSSLSLDASEHYVAIETQSELTRGMTVVDRLNVAEDERNQQIWSEAIRTGSKANVCWALDVERWKAALFRSLAI